MTITVIFKLKDLQTGVSPYKQKETPVNMYFNYGYYILTDDKKKKYTPLKFATGLKIKPCFWKDWPTYRAKQIKEFNHENFNIRLEKIKRAATEVLGNEKNAGRLPTPDQLRNLLRRELNSIPELANPVKVTLNGYIDQFIKERETETRSEGGKKYRPGTIKNYKSFKSQFNYFQTDQGKKYDFDDIGKDFYEKFVKFFEKKDYSPNTIGRHIKCFKTIMGGAHKANLHSNDEINADYFKRPSAKTFDIYLSRDEITKLEKQDLTHSKHQDLARDVFLVGVYTAQRYSDYSRIRKENIRTLQSGTRVIDLIQKKTGNRVVIPIMPELDVILKKYNYTLPATYDQKVNKYIKEVAELAGITELIPIEKVRGALEVKNDIKKCKLIKTHTARRSGITNMYLAGIPTVDIMKISGHKSESEFLKYIKVDNEETADILSKHSYFNNHLKIAT